LASLFSFLLLMASLPARAAVDEALLAIDAGRRSPLDVAASELEHWRPRFDTANTESRRLFLQLSAEIQLEKGELAQAEVTLDRLAAQSEAKSDTAGLAIASALSSQLSLSRGKTADSLREARRGASLADAQANERVRAFAWAALARALQWMGRFEEALSVSQTALSHLGPDAPARDRARFSRVLARINFEMHDMRRALEYAQEMKKLLEQDGDLWFMPTSEMLLSAVYSDTGHAEESRQMLVLAMNDGERLGLKMQAQAAQTNLSDWYLTQEKWTEAVHYARGAIALSKGMDENTQEGVARSNLGQALVGLGQLQEGIVELERSVEIANHADDLSFLAETLPELAECYNRVGRVKEAYLAMLRYREKNRELAQVNRERLVTEMQERFDAARRDRQIEQLRTQNQVQSATVARQRAEMQARGAAVLVLIGAMALALLLFRRVRRSNLALEEANARLAYFAERDPLTGLLNRRAMLSWLEVQRAGASESGLGLMLLDIDHFKAINDQFGHGEGDIVIVELARRLQELLREDDRLARWGGEEFLIVVRDVRPEHLEALAQRILRRIGSEPFVLASGEIAVSLSLGFIACPLSAESDAAGWEAHLVLADQALFLAKRRGRNRACGIVELLRPWAEARRALDVDFQQALTAGFVRPVWCEGPELGDRALNRSVTDQRLEA
jgi:diguanylate cyclase (GGDEF)-like protein